MVAETIKKITFILAIMLLSLLIICRMCDGLTPSELLVDEHNLRASDTFGTLSVRFSADSVSAGAVGKKAAKGEIMLFGAIPVKDVDLSFSERRRVIPGGIPFGIRIYSDGLVVSELPKVHSDGDKESPAAKSGISKGDIILSVNGKQLKTNEELLQSVEGCGGKPLRLLVRHNTETFVSTVFPLFDTGCNAYKIGMLVRDSSAGIGTMTFYDPANGCFAGLGHGICDADSGSIVPLEHGDIVGAEISSVTKSVCGSPGTLSGYFTDQDSRGTLLRNCEFGVYGSYQGKTGNNTYIPVAYRQEIKKGNAKLLCTIDGAKSEYYDISIEDISFSELDTCKNMVIKITDPRLLSKTGGIVQGMSGSPIIQNGMLAGAVTHVFVNDPSYGYAVFAETMLYNEYSVDKTA